MSSRPSLGALGFGAAVAPAPALVRARPDRGFRLAVPSRRAARRSAPPRAFLKGMFGGGNADESDADSAPPSNAQVATGEKTLVTVTLRRPLGLVLDALDDDRRGAIVAELVDGGEADRSGMIEVGDVLTACAFDDSDEQCVLTGQWYENIVDELAGGPPGCDSVTLTLERVVYEDDEDMLTQTADAKRYWEEKRAQKAKAPKQLRRTPGVEPKDIRLDVKGGSLGSGSFGKVFRGTFKGSEAVILKNAKAEVLAAEELLEMEMELNYHVHARARGAVARFMGCIELGPKDGGELYNGTLTEGLWLMWANEGEKTLEALMLEGDDALASAMGLSSADDPSLVAVEATRQMLEKLARLHACGVVHRDVKPANCIVATNAEVPELKLIDLGAAALCLGDGPLLNYYPGVGPADPRYCKPGELYLLPDGAPRPTPANARKLWDAHAPDRFDAFSAGLTLMQLAAPALRPADKLDGFLAQLDAVGCDLGAWRETSDAGGLSAPALDADGGAGWDLAAALLASERKARPSAEEALEHRFFA